MGPLAAVGLVGAAAKAGLGIFQAIKGARMKVDRPDYQIPDELEESQALAQQNLNARMAGAGYAERNIMQNQANMLGFAGRNAGSGADMLAMAAGAQATSNRSMNQLGAAEDQAYAQRLQGLQRANAAMAAAKDKQFQLNQYQPYLDRSATKSALMGSGLTNIFGGMDSAFQTTFLNEQMKGLKYQ